MFCGFGAVVLLVLILNTDTVNARNETFSHLRAETLRLEETIEAEQKHLVALRNSLRETERERVVTEGASERVIRLLRELAVEKADLAEDTLARQSHVNALSSDLETLQEQTRRLGAQLEGERDRGAKVHQFVGEGDRQYLTGLKLGGRRILILLDASTSMLDETVVNAILRRHQNDAQKRAAPKWRRAVRTVEWFIANLPAQAEFQVYGFDVEARAVAEAGHGNWLRASAQDDVIAVVKALRRLTPGRGTSLYHAFSAAADLQPPPDNIVLVTDGLPTQGRFAPVGSTVSGSQRLRHFEQALGRLPRGVPVNVILLPMEGDAVAAAAYWRLALNTRGSFLTPARDWP